MMIDLDMCSPLMEVNQQAITILTDQLGLVDAIRFVSQFSNGNGDDTSEREQRFGQLSVNEIVNRIEVSGHLSAEPQ